MSNSDGHESQFLSSTESPHGASLMLNFENLSLETGLETELHIQAQMAYEVFQARGDLHSLEVCIECDRLVMDTTDDDSLAKAGTLSTLAHSVMTRFRLVGAQRDLEEALSLDQLSNAITPDDSPNKPRRLRNLAASLKYRYEREGSSEDLEEAARLETRAIELLPDGDEDEASMLNSLGNSLLMLYQRTGNVDELRKAISLQSRAVGSISDDDPAKAIQYLSLGNSLSRRFQELGDLEDLEESVKLFKKAAEITQDSDQMKHIALLNAGASLDIRFERLGDIDDIERAIQLKSRAISLIPDGHIDQGMLLGSLALSLQTRYGRTTLAAHDAKDLEQAIIYNRRALELNPNGHHYKTFWLNNLGTELWTRFMLLENSDDMDAAITLYADVAKTLPEQHPHRPRSLLNLSDSLLQRFLRTGDETDLGDAIRHITDSVELLPKNHPSQAKWLRSLALSLHTRLRSPYAQDDDATHMIEALFQATQQPNSPPLERLSAYCIYANLLIEFAGRFSTPLKLSAAEAWQQALSLVPQCIWLGNKVRSRYASRELQEVGTQVNAAVTSAIMIGEYGRALEWLEAGRAVVWSQVAQLRTPIDDLQQRHPQLADQFHHVSQALALYQVESSTMALPTTMLAGKAVSTKPPHATRDQSSHIYALEYSKLIAQIRQLEGFEGFMRPKTLSQLSYAYTSGPVVIINMHRSRCDALALCSDGAVVHIPLPDFSLSETQALQSWLWDFLARHHLLSRWHGDDDGEDELELEERGIKPRGAVRNAHDIMRELLALLWDTVVKPILDAISTLLPSGDTLPHITWCPTGPLAFLPLHAAGIYPKDELDPTPVQTIMDVAVSSYAPTLEALLKPRTKTAVGDECPKTLIVSQSDTPGCNPISGTTEEAAIITSLLDLSSTTILDAAEGTVDAVLEGMTTHNWVHLACHGIQNCDDPINSAFALYDGKLTLEMLMTKHLPNADIAVLSACQTATGNENLPEEFVHLTAGMLNVGFKSVIGTMWSIYDRSAPVVMGEFYRVMVEQVKRGGELQPAYALHEATNVLREKYGVTDFVRWMPFVHFGL